MTWRNKAGKSIGSCVCGAVRFEVTFPSLFCAHCHCDNCRRAQSAPYVTWVGFKSPQVRIITGRRAVVCYSYNYKLDNKRITSFRKFCKKCGTPLFFESSRWPGDTHVPRTAILGPVDRKPQLHFYFDRRPAWVLIKDRLPKYGGKAGGKRIK